MDGIELAVLKSRFERIVSSMVNTVTRTGRSGVLNTARDCSCCILTNNDEFLIMADSQPIHVMSGPDLMAKAMKEFHPDLQRGDAFLHNSPYHGNSHPADHSILIPVIDDDGNHRFTVFTKAHQADDGASQPTTYFAAARDVYEEGALIFPCVKVQENFTDREDVVRMCKMRIRAPEQWWGDYLALLGGARVGERQVLALGQELGWDTLERFVTEWLDYSEARMKRAIHELPSGTITLRGHHDPFPGVPDGVPLSVEVSIDQQEGRISVDLTDNPDCLPCGLNLSEATSRTAVILGVLHSIDHTVPPNAGSCRRLEILLRENCCVGVPRHPASCAAATTNLMERVANLVQRAIAELSNGAAGRAEAGLIIPPGGGVISGSLTGDRDAPDHVAPFVNEIFFALTGGPATPHADGWLNFFANGVGGVAFRDSVELDELRYPIRIHEQRVIADSEGAGRFRGAPAAYVEYGPVRGPVEVMYVSDGSVYPARGACGGQDGTKAKQLKRLRDGTLEEVEACGHVVLEPGETILSMCSSGGGYGDPHDRDVTLVVRDVRNGFVSRDRAADAYGVIFDTKGDLDVSATNFLRARRRRNAQVRE